MPIDLLISPPSSGKTEECVQRVRGLLLERPFAPIRVVLPDRLQCAAFRRRLAEAGGAMGVQVGTFGDLYRELLARAGSPAPLASTPMVHRMVQSAVDESAAAGILSYFAALRGTAGFPLILREAFAELKRALVMPDDFSRLAAEGSPAQQELAALYQMYQNRLRSLGWADPEGLSWLAVEALQANPGSARGIDLLLLDGFDSFTGAQRRALCLLAEEIPDILITLPGEFPFRRAAHRRFAAAYHELAECLPLTVRTLSSHSHLPASLRWVEKLLYQPNPPPALRSADLTLLEARSPAEEAREALRWLKARMLRDGISLAACAVVTPDPDLYHPYLRQAAAEFGVPLRFTQGEVLSHSPAVTALLDLLNLPAQNFPRRLLLDALRSPYFDFSFCKLDARSAEILDLASSYGQIIAGRDQWDEVMERLTRSEQTARIDHEEEGETRPALPQGQRAQDLWTALSRLFTRLAPPAGDQTITGWIRWLEDLLDDLRFYQSGAGELDESVFEQLREALRALVGSEAVLGSASEDYSGFLTELQGTLDSMGYREPLPGRQPAVLVLRIMEARGVRFQAVAMLGLSEGIFPALERADPFMSETLRSTLRLESRLQREQAGLFYQAVTRADRFLLLTRPYLADDGETWLPSPYWKAVMNLFVEESVVRIRPDDARPLEEAASPEEALFWLVRRRALPPAFAELRPRWEHIGHGQAVLRARQAKKAAGPYEGFPQELAPTLLDRYGPSQTWSASRLETYGTCPHSFFVSYALGLEAKEPPELGYSAAQLGTLLHAVLEHAYREAADPADAQSVLAVLPEVARREFASAPQEYGFRPSPLWQIQQQQLLDALQRSIEGLAEEDAGHGWVPYAYEVQFGRGDAPALEAPFGGGSIRIAGLIDRVDRDRHGRLRIIDYKTGSSHLGKEDLVQGRRLQLPLYALAASQALKLGLPDEGFYWMILRGAASPLKLSRFECEAGSGPQAAVQVVLEHIERMLNSIFQAEFPPEPPKGGCPGYCPARSWCWHYAPGWGAV